MPGNPQERTLSWEDRHILEHSTAWPKCYRNHFAANPDSIGWKRCTALVERGLMERGANIPGSTGMVYFHVTDAGKALLEGGADAR